MSITPEWGRMGSATERFWGAPDARELDGGTAFEPEARLVGEASYGIAAPSGGGTVTPYTGLSWAGEGARTHPGRCTLNIAPGAVLGLEGVHERGNAGEAGTNSVMLRTEVRW